MRKMPNIHIVIYMLGFSHTRSSRGRWAQTGISHCCDDAHVARDLHFATASSPVFEETFEERKDTAPVPNAAYRNIMFTSF
jgi:hypothetical protein